jgi:uncharacterized secreted repeat protein (TIGR03808 family)
LTRALAKAEGEGRPLFLPPGRYEVAAIELPRHAHLIGVPGQSRLVFRGGSFMLRARHAATLRMTGLALDGGGRPLAAPGLLDADDVADLVLDDCAILASGAAALVARASAGRVERSLISGARTVGIDVEQSRGGMTVRDNVVTECGDTGILVARDRKGADGSIVSGNRVRAIRAQSGGSGQNGNGINLDKANGVVVSDNSVEDCAFSAIRCFSSDAVIVTGNIAAGSGEVALYVEFAFEGAIVANNLIDGGTGGISFANFAEHGGRLGACSGNVVRRIRAGPRYPDGNPQIGVGIAAEADVALSGNLIEDAVWGLQLGWGPHLRDVSATGNVIRRTRIGIAVSVVEGAGPAVIAHNLISSAAQGAILGTRWEEAATGELAHGDANGFPHLTVTGNRVA